MTNTCDTTLVLPNILNEPIESIREQINKSNLHNNFDEYTWSTILRHYGKEELIPLLGLPSITEGDLLLPHHNELVGLMCNVYTSLEEKLDMITRYVVVSKSMLDGLSGDTNLSGYTPSIVRGIMIGIILNAYLPEDKVASVLQKYDETYIRKLTPDNVKQVLAPYMERLRNGDTDGLFLPLQLIWQATDIFRVSDSYENDVLAYTSKAPPCKASADLLLLAAGRYEDLESGAGEHMGAPSHIYSMGSRYGYTIRS